ncbi:MAG: serine hydrolase [bacterium]|nr:serine hydrolase [bacterium]
MRKFIFIIIYTIVLLLVGRSLIFLPKIGFITSPQKETEAVKKDIKKVTDAAPGSYGIYYASLVDDNSFGINEKQVFTGGSVNKIPIIAVLYHLADKNKINLDEVITLKKEDIQDYGTGSLRYQKPGATYSFKTLTKLSLQQSDNTAAHIISTKIGTDVVQKTINDWGLSQTDMINNKTSPYDMYLLFTKIYKGEVTNEALTKELLGFLTDSDFEDRIPINLPKDVKVYHKTGDTLGGVHDLGIIENKGKAFYLGVMTTDIGNNENETKQYIGVIAKKIFNLSQEN